MKKWIRFKGYIGRGSMVLGHSYYGTFKAIAISVFTTQAIGCWDVDYSGCIMTCSFLAVEFMSGLVAQVRVF